MVSQIELQRRDSRDFELPRRRTGCRDETGTREAPGSLPRMRPGRPSDESDGGDVLRLRGGGSSGGCALAVARGAAAEITRSTGLNGPRKANLEKQTGVKKRRAQ